MVAEDLYFEGEKYLPVGVASKRTKYTADYIGQLCRKGKIKGRRMGKAWLVEEKSLLTHLSTQGPLSKNRAFREEGGEGEYIPVRTAAEKTKYGADYIGQLCRAGKVKARQVGRIWFVEENSLLSHLKKSGSISKNYQFRKKEELVSSTPLPEISKEIIGRRTDERVAEELKNIRNPVPIEKEILLPPLVKKVVEKVYIEREPSVFAPQRSSFQVPIQKLTPSPFFSKFLVTTLNIVGFCFWVHNPN